MNLCHAKDVGMEKSFSIPDNPFNLGLASSLPLSTKTDALPIQYLDLDTFVRTWALYPN
jgi:hypothetical protein